MRLATRTTLSAAPLGGLVAEIPTSFPDGSFLAGLDAADRSDLMHEGRPMSLPAGATLLFEGDLSDRVVVVLTGNPPRVLDGSDGA
jgi:hypothetical protein